jgi:hypothetical protein
MSIGEAIILASVVNLLGMMVILQLRDRTWFKKQNWKHNQSITKRMNDLKIEQMRKEMGLSKKGKTETSRSIENLISKGISGALGGEEGEGLGGYLGDWLEDHPEVISAFLKGISEGKGNQPETGIFET